ncbi:hypothetical protein D3C80_1500950 [compost metagenome]
MCIPDFLVGKIDPVDLITDEVIQPGFNRCDTCYIEMGIIEISIPDDRTTLCDREKPVIVQNLHLTECEIIRTLINFVNTIQAYISVRRYFQYDIARAFRDQLISCFRIENNGTDQVIVYGRINAHIIFIGQL